MPSAEAARSTRSRTARGRIVCGPRVIARSAVRGSHSASAASRRTARRTSIVSRVVIMGPSSGLVHVHVRQPERAPRLTILRP